MNTKEKENQEDQSLEQNLPGAWTKYAPKSSLSAQDDEPYEVPEIRTELPLPARPVVKGGFALALSGSALVLIWIVFQLASGISWNNAKQSTSEGENSPVAAKPSSKMTAEEKLQWCLASGKCSEEKPITVAKAASKTNSPKKKREDPTLTRSPSRPNASPGTSSAPIREAEYPVRTSRPIRSRYVAPPPPPPVSPPQRRLISPVQPVQAVSSRSVTSTPVELRAAPQKSHQQTSDPIALLAQASNLGVYTTVRGVNPSPSYPSSQYSRPAQLVADQRLIDDSEGLAEINARTTTNQRFGKVIPVTTRIKAAVATSISWVGDKTEQKFRIQTTEDVKAEDNSIALPKGTYLLAQVNQSNPSGYTSVQILSAQINGQEKPIPVNTILVQGTNGEPIQAKVKNKKGGLGKTIVAAGLAGINGAASTLNSTKIIVGDTTTVSGGSNVGAAIVGGVAGSLSQEISGRIGQPTRSIARDEPVLVLKSGTKLELFINEPLSL